MTIAHYMTRPDELKINEGHQHYHIFALSQQYIVELQWLEQLWNHENMFETGVVRANEC